MRAFGFVQAITHTFMHGFQNYLTVVVLEEEKCHLKQIFLYRLKVKDTLEGHIN